LIQKIGQRVDFGTNRTTNNYKPVQGEKQPMQNPIETTTINPKLLQKYYINFGAKSSQPTKEQILEQSYSQNAEELIDNAALIAKKYGHSEINENHIELAALLSIREYIEDLDSDAKSYDNSGAYQTPDFFEKIASPEVFKDKKERAKIKPVIDEEILNLTELLSKRPKTGSSPQKPALSKSMTNNIYDMYMEFVQQTQSEMTPVGTDAILSAVFTMNQKESDNRFRKFMNKFCEVTMVDSRKPYEKVHLGLYDDKAKNILKNISLGTNMFITHDSNANPTYLVDSIVDVLCNQGLEFGKINKNNTKITVFNDSIKEHFFLGKVKELAKEEKGNHIVILNEDSMLSNSAKIIENKDGTFTAQAGFSPDFLDLMENQPRNVKIIFIESKNGYYSNMSDPKLQKIFENFGETSFPVLSTEQAKKAFREQPLLMAKIDVPFSKKAIDKAIEASAALEGTYPKKAQKLMKQIASYYIDKKEITEKDVKDYAAEAKDLFKLTGEDSSVEVVFDTGKKLSDMVGKNATKKEAEAIVKQIKNGTLGTKGALIYSQDESVGSGRKFTAKAIAGESKSPYIEINALDFGTKDVNIFGGAALTPEASIKKLFSIVKTQADANPNKAAVLFIENFEYFSVGEYVSQYHQKAMSQLLREMENASKKGLNILVLGSVNDPELIGESTIKSFKFIDKIEVESPSRNIDARKEILTNAIKERKIKIAGETDAEKKEIIKLMAETTKYFPFVYLINLVDKSKTVAFERGHKQIEKADVVEAYLQLTTGRPSSGPISEHSKRIVASHECGHALNLEIMWNLAQKQNIPWHLPDRVNFITLDPRGYYGGAMYHKDGENEEYSFEKTFANLVCDYGGHSAEKYFYNIDGSLGITGDLESATNSATWAVQRMGQGYYTGKKSVGGMHQAPSGRVKANMDKDVDILLANSLTISDLVTEVYADFNREFTDKYSGLVGTGDCLIQGDMFRKELEDWIAKQSEQKRDEIETLNEIILKAIKATQKGQKY